MTYTLIIKEDKPYLRECATIPRNILEQDEIIQAACDLILSQDCASRSLLQRRLKIGYSRACRIMDALHEAGIVSEENSVRMREITLPCYPLLSMPSSWKQGDEIREDMVRKEYEVLRLIDKDSKERDWMEAYWKEYDSTHPDMRRIVFTPAEQQGSGEEAYAALKPISDRINYFANRYHKYEANELRNALNVIMRLVPPENFTAPASPSPVEGGVEELAKECVRSLGWDVDGTAESNDMIKCFIAGHAAAEQGGKGVEAIEVLDWVLKSRFEKDGNICFRDYDGTGSHQFTPEQVYKAFVDYKKI